MKVSRIILFFEILQTRYFAVFDISLLISLHIFISRQIHIQFQVINKEPLGKIECDMTKHLSHHAFFFKNLVINTILNKNRISGAPAGQAVY